MTFGPNYDVPPQSGPIFSPNFLGGGQLGINTVRGELRSENWVAGVSGWRISGTGDAEFNDTDFRGDLQSDNYVAGVSGWRLTQDGDAYFNEITVKNGIIAGGALADDSIGASKLEALNIVRHIRSTSYTAGSAGWSINPDGSAEFNNVTVRGTLDGVGGTFSGNLSAAGGTFTGTISADQISGGTITGVVFRTAASGQRVQISNNAVRFFNASNVEVATLSPTGFNTSFTITAPQTQTNYISHLNGVSPVQIGGIDCDAAFSMLGQVVITTSRVLQNVTANASIITGGTLTRPISTTLACSVGSLASTGNVNTGQGGGAGLIGCTIGSGGTVVARVLRMHHPPTGAAFNVTFNATTGNLQYETSTRVEKQNFRLVNDAGSIIDQLEPVRYDRIDGSRNDEIGLIAESTHEVEPDLALCRPDGTPGAIRYDGVTALLVAAVQDLRTRVTTLEATP